MYAGPFSKTRVAVETALIDDPPAPVQIGGVIATSAPAISLRGQPITWPVTEARSLRPAFERAPFGDGGLTRVAPEVRQGWHLEPRHLEVDGLDAHLPAVCARVSQALGIDAPLKARLYRLLMVETGGFFEAHRDTVKTPGHVATVVIGLPAEHEGGALVTASPGHRTRRTLRPRPDGLPWVAFHADCVHALEPVTSGVRLALVYSLIQTAPPGRPKPATNERAKALSHWADLAPGEPLVIPLHHRYPASTLDAAHLKGADRRLLASALNLSRPISLAPLQVESVEEYGREIRARLGAGRGVSDDADRPARPLAVRWLSRPWAWIDPDQQAIYQVWSGNEGTLSAYRYTRAALVIEPAKGANWPEVDTAHLMQVHEHITRATLEASRRAHWTHLDLTVDLHDGRALAGLPALRSLRLSNLFLEEAPPALEHLERLELLNVHLPRRALSALLASPRLKHLKITGTSISPAEAERLALCPLERLELIECKVRLPDGLNASGQLTWLDLRGSTIKTLPVSVCTPALRHLNISQTGLKHLSVLSSATGLETLLAGHLNQGPCPPLEALPALRQLDLTGTSWGAEALPKLMQRPELARLQLSGSDLRVLPEDWSALTGLIELDVSANMLAPPPRSLLAHQSLRALSLPRLPISGLTISAPRLDHLSVRGSNLHHLELVGLDRLAHLEITETRLDALPALPRTLRTLICTRSHLTHLPGDLDRLPHLEVLDVHRNQINELPEVLSRCTTLRRLNLSENEMAHVPALSALKELRDLNLASMGLQMTPALGHPEALQSLNLAENPALGRLPVEIEHLAELTHLHAHSCGLMDLPADLSGLMSLRVMSLFHNDFQDREAVTQSLETLPDLHLLWLSYGYDGEASPAQVALRHWRKGEAEEWPEPDESVPYVDSGDDDIPF